MLNEQPKTKTLPSNLFNTVVIYCYHYKNVNCAMHFIYLHNYNTNSAEDSSDMN